jgi:hypothetical protein
MTWAGAGVGVRRRQVRGGRRKEEGDRRRLKGGRSKETGDRRRREIVDTRNEEPVLRALASAGLVLALNLLISFFVLRHSSLVIRHSSFVILSPVFFLLH